MDTVEDKVAYGRGPALPAFLPGEISYTGARAHESSHHQYSHRDSPPEDRSCPDRGHHGFLHVGLRHRSERHSGASPQGAVRTELHPDNVDSVHLLLGLFSDVDTVLAHPGALGLPEIDCAGARSEERRVGKECRSRWSPY